MGDILTQEALESAKKKLEDEGEILLVFGKKQEKAKIHRIWIERGALLVEVEKPAWAG